MKLIRHAQYRIHEIKELAEIAWSSKARAQKESGVRLGNGKWSVQRLSDKKLRIKFGGRNHFFYIELSNAELAQLVKASLEAKISDQSFYYEREDRGGVGCW